MNIKEFSKIYPFIEINSYSISKMNRKKTRKMI